MLTALICSFTLKYVFCLSMVQFYRVLLLLFSLDLVLISNLGGFQKKIRCSSYFLILYILLPLWHFLIFIFFYSVHFKLNFKRLYLSFLDISFLSSRLKVWGGLWLKLYLQYRLELTCNQDLSYLYLFER